MAERNIGYDFTAKDKTPPEYICLVCHLLLRDATELSNCHHVFCKQCLIKWEDKKREEDENQNLKCSLCQEPYQLEQKHSNRPFDRLITTSLDVLCKQHEIGCNWCGKIIDYQDHFGVCQFVMAECRFQGCDASFLRKDQQHHELDCEHRLIKCELCGIDQKFHEMEQHEQETCQNFEVNCPNARCDVILKRKEVVTHFEDCLYEKVSCDFHDVGCNVTVLRQDLEQHNALHNNQHLKLVLHKCMQTDQELKKTEDKLTITQAQLDKTNQRLEIIIAEKNEVNEKLTKLEEHNDEYFKNCFNAIERSTKIISKYLLEIKEDASYESIVKQGEHFDSILPLLEEEKRKIYEEKFAVIPPMEEAKEEVLEHKGVKYDFDDLNKLNKVLVFIQQQEQQEQQEKQEQQYEKKMEFIFESMEQGKLYQKYEEFFFKLKIDFELPLNFRLDVDIARNKPYHEHHMIFSNSDLMFLKDSTDSYYIWVNMGEFSNDNSDLYLSPYKQGCKKRVLEIGGNIFNDPVQEYYKSPNNEVLFYVEKK